MASFRCADIGMQCDFDIKGASSADEIMGMVPTHARMTHNIQTVPADLAAKIRSAIKS